MSSEFIKAIQDSFLPGDQYVSSTHAEIAPRVPPVKLIAFYLPQFHPIPENDEWWGKGFTEWTNVTRGLPRYRGHHQPILPGDLGFYDLRQKSAIQEQVLLAKRSGVYGFCLHTYWFAGRRLLQRPLEIILENPDIDMPFCLCWANENWTRRWDGFDHEILMSQHHTADDDIAFVRTMVPALNDPRYIRIDGRPLIIVYRPHLLPDPLATARRWRSELAKAGVSDPFLVMVQAFGQHDPRWIGFDAALEFPPHKVGFGAKPTKVPIMPETNFEGMVLSYNEMVQRSITQPLAPFTLFRGVCPRWDNEARRPGRGTSFIGATPSAFEHWLTSACTLTVEEQSPSKRLVFINSWNEWAEGAQLEPDRHFGHAFLSATASALQKTAQRVARNADPNTCSCQDKLCRIPILVHDAHFHGAQLLGLNLADTIRKRRLADVEILLGGAGELQSRMAEVAPTRLVGSGFSDHIAWRKEAHDLANAGSSVVIVNSLVSAINLEILRAAGLKTIVLIHEMIGVIREYNLEETARNVARFADVVVFPNNAVQNSFKKHFGAISRRSVLMPQGLYHNLPSDELRETARIATRSALGVRSDEILVLGLGFGDERKGVDLWPAIAHMALNERKNLRFVWVGGVHQLLEPKLRRDIEEMGLNEAVLFPGRTDQPADFLAAADIFLLSSREDPFPSAALEAAAYGLPILCFEESGGIPDFVNKTGLSAFPFQDLRRLVDGLIELADNPARRQSAGNLGAALIRDKYNFLSYAERLVETASCSDIRITAVIPNYNYANFLEERISSIWAQTYPVEEIIVIDDASSDNSISIIHALAAKSPIPMRVISNPVNSGSVSKQWAAGVQLARTPLVWIAEADDTSAPQFLESLAKSFYDPSIVMAYTQSCMMDATGVVTSRDYKAYTADVDPHRWDHDYTSAGHVEISRALCVKNTIPNVSAVLFRRSAIADLFEANLDLMLSFRNAADWLCYIRMLELGRIYFCAEPLNFHRRHSRGVTLSASDRTHLFEIARVQAIAKKVVSVESEKEQAALSFLRHAAQQFGLTEADVLAAQDAAS